MLSGQHRAEGAAAPAAGERHVSVPLLACKRAAAGVLLRRTALVPCMLRISIPHRKLVKCPATTHPLILHKEMKRRKTAQG